MMVYLAESSGHPKPWAVSSALVDQRRAIRTRSQCARFAEQTERQSDLGKAVAPAFARRTPTALAGLRRNR